MKNNTKNERITLIISVSSLIIASITLVVSKINGMTMLPNITIFVSAISIFLCSIANYNYIEKNKKISNFLFLGGIFTLFIVVISAFKIFV
ncbi:hypothetical protein [Clostridium sp.]|uniref:hypothetical protein n=1 Tax=Clostridium sp. TaxID=1506 RepID=UPI001A3D799A|nr:hypothetical protein [Clostridium sp.]MBK5242956.1 hypothetical protein [Clostridium sp.]